MNKTMTDRIEKEIVLKAPRARVWRALTDSEEFGTWFRVDLEGPFEVGRNVQGRVTCPGYEHLPFELMVERMEPESLFTFRWCPHAKDPGKDYSGEPTTLVEFRLEDAGRETRLSLVESGFDQLPPDVREECFRSNSRGWREQMKNIRHHVEDE